MNFPEESENIYQILSRLGAWGPDVSDMIVNRTREIEWVEEEMTRREMYVGLTFAESRALVVRTREYHNRNCSPLCVGHTCIWMDETPIVVMGFFVALTVPEMEACFERLCFSDGVEFVTGLDDGEEDRGPAVDGETLRLISRYLIDRLPAEMVSAILARVNSAGIEPNFTQTIE